MPAAAKRRRAAAPEPTLTNLQKVYWPRDRLTKGDLIEYYRSVAPIMLPYLRDRPQSLNRHPNGIEGKSFYQKNMSKQPPPEWVETVKIKVDTPEGHIQSVVCQNEATLLYLANLGCIEINPWNSRINSIERPDWLVIDLDPETIGFNRVIEAAQAVHRLLDKAGAANYCKTSGKTGLHIYVSLAAEYDYDLVRRFAEIVANLVHADLPATTSVVRKPALRQKRVYLDYLQNSRGQTLAAPYSVRPAPAATISTPLKWSEVRAGLDPTRYTIRTVPKRIDRLGDLWSPVIGPAIDIEDCLGRLS